MKPHAPQWLIAKLGDDLNWWVAETSDARNGDVAPRGILDPRQVAHLVSVLTDYADHGLPDNQFAAAFTVYQPETELSDGRLRLSRSDDNIYNTSAELFALPGPEYDQFLTTLSAAHIRRLNRDHHFACNCTEDEMLDELELLDSDRYFNAEQIHAFDEINEILEWDPAQWDDSSSA